MADVSACFLGDPEPGDQPVPLRYSCSTHHRHTAGQRVPDSQETKMTNSSIRLSTRVVGILVLIPLAAIVTWWVVELNDLWPRGQALKDALSPMISQDGTNQSIVASAILTNYSEIRGNAARWSGIYWGCTFGAALFSALAGLILKLESIPIEDKPRKDVSATLAVTAAILVTISTSGDFQRKWQANRIAAAELERAGYAFLGSGGTDPLPFHATIGKTLHKRHMAIVGGSEEEASSYEGIKDGS